MSKERKKSHRLKKSSVDPKVCVPSGERESHSTFLQFPSVRVDDIDKLSVVFVQVFVRTG